jgi:hypothetical protein
MNIRGDSGRVEQALFWCFARMGKSFLGRTTLIEVGFLRLF